MQRLWRGASEYISHYSHVGIVVNPGDSVPAGIERTMSHRETFGNATNRYSGVHLPREDSTNVQEKQLQPDPVVFLCFLLSFKYFLWFNRNSPLLLIFSNITYSLCFPLLLSHVDKRFPSYHLHCITRCQLVWKIYANKNARDALRASINNFCHSQGCSMFCQD